MHSPTYLIKNMLLIFKKRYILELKGLEKAATVTCNEIIENIMLLPTMPPTVHITVADCSLCS